MIDDRSNTDAIVSGGIGRGLFGLYAGADARYYLGTMNGLDGGVTLTYTFPRHWFPGLLMVRAMGRYFREDVALIRPIIVEGQPQSMPEEEDIPVQESYLGFVGIEWRM